MKITYLYTEREANQDTTPPETSENMRTSTYTAMAETTHLALHHQQRAWSPLTSKSVQSRRQKAAFYTHILDRGWPIVKSASNYVRAWGGCVSSQRYSQCRNRNWVTWSVPSIKERSVLLLYSDKYTLINTICSLFFYSILLLFYYLTKTLSRHFCRQLAGLRMVISSD